jgi:hypothetical protein
MLNTSKVYFNENRSVIWVTFEREISAFFCHVWRKMLRWPEVKLVSKVSPAGIPFVALGVSNGKVKQAAFNAGWPGVTPLNPVTAPFGVHPLAKVNGSMGFVMPSKMP